VLFTFYVTCTLILIGKVLLEESIISMTLKGEVENQELSLPLTQMQN
jgi:hypothetical protein